MKYNKDLEDIKARFDNSGVNAPGEINGDYVKDIISEKPQKKVSFSAAKKRAVGTVAAACVALVAVVGLMNGNLQFFKKEPVKPAQNTPVAQAGALTAFASYKDVEKALEKLGTDSRLKSELKGVTGVFTNSFNMKKSAVADGYAVDESAGEIAAANSEPDAYGKTYTQVEGVDEPDIIKTNGEYIFYLFRESCISVFSAKGDKSKLVTKIEFKDDTEWAQDMFLYGDRLAVIYNDYSKDEEVTGVKIYDISDAKNIKEKDSFRQSGNYVDSRVVGARLYLVSNDYAYDREEIPVVKEQGESEKKVECTDIYSVERPSAPSFLVISGIDLEKPDSSKPQTKAILGSSDTVYCSGENMYVNATVWSTTPVVFYDGAKDETAAVEEDEEIAYDEGPDSIQTQIIKISLGKKIKFEASAKVEGTINSQYSLDERGGYLRVAVTTQDKDYNDINTLYVLDSDLKTVGKVKDFAKTESIKAVKYIGDYAYVITYEQTDPLFVIDLSNPRKPVILGEAKIDGFSSMLVPVGDGKLLGIGYSTHFKREVEMEVTDGLKLVVFDISDKTNPKVIDETVFKEVYSDVQTNPRALMYNAERGDFCLPVNRSSGEYYSDTDSGVILFSVTSKGKIEVKREYISDVGNYSAQRCTWVEDNIYILFDDEELIDSIPYEK